MLLARVLTALVLVPLVVAGVLLARSDLLALVFGLFIVLGAREMGRLGGLRHPFAQWGYAVLVGAGITWLHYFLPWGLDDWLELAAAGFWLPATLYLLARRRELGVDRRLRPGILLLGALQLAVAWLSLIGLHRDHSHGPELVLSLLVLIWVADSAAYFAGRAWGRHKLSPRVSPGKTWEGAAGALAGALLVGLLVGRLGLAQAALPGLLGLCLLTTVVSIGGDLWESLLKRQAGLKDSGALLPGHGGVLDRIDSLIAAAPVFVIGLQLLEHGL
jgi:phosphatidate cytidylyltransferase